MTAPTATKLASLVSVRGTLGMVKKSCGCCEDGLSALESFLLYMFPFQLFWFPGERILECFHDTGNFWEEVMVVDHADKFLESFNDGRLRKF